MPPKTKFSREMIVDAAFDILRTQGADTLNARSIADRLGCSTQPVLYHFRTVDEIRKAVYQKADAYHTSCIMRFEGENPLLEIGMNYIRFGREEPHLFQFLFQSDGLSGKSLSELIDAEELLPLLRILARETHSDPDTARHIFRSVCMVAHGYASMLANNMIEIDEREIASDLDMIFTGIMTGLHPER